MSGVDRAGVPRPVVCLDLDRTVIYSAAALALDVPDELAPRLLCVETYRAAPLSYMTERAAAMFLRLREAATVVPTTTRTVAQLARVRLPGPPAPFAVAANGGHLLIDGMPDPDWAERVRGRLAGVAPIDEVRAHLDAVSGPFVRTLRDADAMFVYAVVDRDALPAGWVDDLAGWCAPRGWRVSLQGRKVYAVPLPLTKAAAAEEVRARCGGGTLFAAGDSLLDTDLLEAADVAIRPAHGELADTGWRRPHLTVTAARGVAAGEELVELLATQVIPTDISVSGTLGAGA
ncbi:MAG: HAD family hydrolase [Pseudonocardia sp.]|uniref:HAD family hydrolase n=1 Tax=unclassified Pseudonocardia TaxID=2619320 RepID=UPI00086E342E|nr:MULTISPECIES: HAD family hydrolase [unclassified Pseudonocardia]MBN9112802.1 HAD family hydrolase [Pseudonocardia sp.]ODU05027.1 MAG: HAD family hydrolase [Pseudonocardia sp. SCN 72-51]ODV00377.1 MAG: HAD family hydrolase [Pseudonocardia sp. SCN 73-27]